MRKFLVLATSMLLLVLGLPTNSYALEKCFSDVADSAWQNGEPDYIKSKLNYELVGKKTTNYPLLMYSNLAYKGSKFESTYEYSGVNCSIRKIIISSDSNSIQPIFHSLDDWKTRVKLSAKNFQEEQKNLDTINSAALKFEGLIIEFPVDNKFKTTYTNILQDIPKWRDLVASFTQNILIIPDSNMIIGGRSSYTLLINSIDNCQFSSPIDNKFVSAISPMGISPNRIQFSSMKECRVEVLLASPSTIGLGLDSMKTGLTGFIQFASIILKPISQTSVINCTKGKTTKKVSGKNPKCPKGYKVKA